MRTVIRPLVPRMEYGLRLVYRRIPYSFIFICIFLLMEHSSFAQRASVSCYSRINISINSGIPTKVRLSALTPMSDLNNVIVELDDRIQPEFFCSDVGKIIMASVIDTVIDQSCMVEINVENKSLLQISCRDTAVTCIRGVDDLTGDDLIDVTSSCDALTGTEITFNDSDRILYDIDSDTIEFFQRTWSVKEQNGNILTCESTIYLTRLNLDSIVFPENITIYCGQDAADTTLTGGINYNTRDLAELCQIGITCTIMDTISSPCIDSFKIIKKWVAMDWTNMSQKEVLQFIYVKDTVPVILKAPVNFEVIQDSCDFSLIIGPPTINSSACANVILEDIIVLINNNVFPIGDTVRLPSGTYNLIYRGGTVSCNALIIPDTASVTLSDMFAPVIDCLNISDLAITLENGTNTWVNLDSIFKNLIVSTCDPYHIVGRKVVHTCPSDSNNFTNKLELCPEDLHSCESPGEIEIEIRAMTLNGRLSNSCIVSIDVQEKVPPVITPRINVEIKLDNDSMKFTLHEDLLIFSLTDNSGVIASLTMTGSGIGPTTGSGISFLDSNGPITFDCSLAGNYDVEIIATDCDNNSHTVVTQLSVDPDNICTLPRSISGQIMINNELPFEGVIVNALINEIELAQLTNDKGIFSFDLDHGSSSSKLNIHKEDFWDKGLTVNDMHLLHNYILGLNSLTEWQMASGDIDESGSISVKDLLIIQQLILGKDPELPEAALPWLFSYNGTFKDNLDIEIQPFSPSDLNIVATKRGDIDGDYLLDADSRSMSILEWQVSSIDNNHTSYSLDISQLPELASMQLSMGISTGKIISIQGSSGKIWHDDQSVRILYYPEELSANATDQFLEILVEHATFQIPEFSLLNDIDPIMFDKNGRRKSLEVNMVHDEMLHLELSLELVAQPNPVFERSVLHLKNSNKKSDELSVRLYDIKGKLVFNKSWINVYIDDVFPLELPAFPYNGLFTAQVRIDQRSHFIRIIKN